MGETLSKCCTERDKKEEEDGDTLQSSEKPQRREQHKKTKSVLSSTPVNSADKHIGMD